MKQRLIGAWVAFGIIVSITFIKFVLYWISGSIAVLSEAWHSFADIATTLLVLISIVRQEQKNKLASRVDVTPPQNQETSSEKNQQLALLRTYRKFRAVNSEVKISAGIGIVLLTAAIMILWQAIVSESAEIYAPLTTGIIFVGLSFGSFFIYRFEETLGREENSPALTADSMHNRADMVISLLTGISLIIYYFGTNIDRWVGIFIALYILVFSTELLFNTARTIYHKKQDVIFDYRFLGIIEKIFHPNSARTAIYAFAEKIDAGEKIKSSIRSVPKYATILSRWGIRFILLASITVYLSTAVFTIKSDEQALVSRFGRIDDYEPIPPGLHWKLPYPIDTVHRFQTGKISSVAVGNTSIEETAMIWTREHGDNTTFVSGDNNLFLPYAVIHYKIRDIRHYYLTHRTGVPRKLLESAAYRILNDVFSKNSFYDLILFKRREWTEGVKEQLQKEIDSLRIGIEVVEFCLRDLHPPIDLAGDFENIVAADQERATVLNTAKRHENFVLSNSRMESLETKTEAESYRILKKLTAEGEASNYLLRYEGYQAGGKLTRNLLLLKSAESTLKGKKLFLVDPNSGIDDRLIYIENHLVRGRR